MKIEVVNSMDKVIKNITNKILIISRAQLNDYFDVKKDKEIIDSLKYINSNKIETFENSYVLTFHFDFNEQGKNNTKTEKFGLYTDFKTYSIYVSSNKELLRNLILNSVADKELNHAEILINLIANLTENDYTKLETVENELDKLEEKLSTQKGIETCTSKISYYRKSLIKYKHHYEQLNNIIDFFSSHKNLFSKQEVIFNYDILSKRIPKLYNEILYLREILTQLKDSYQSQVEIKQNNLMKIFTIINAIFLPLQLIVSWYGMNIIMPETKYAITYPIIIIFCLIFSITMLIVFYKKRYFK